MGVICVGEMGRRGEGGVEISEIVAEEDKKKGKVYRKRDLVCWVTLSN